MDHIIKELDRIRKWRGERGNLFLEAVLEASKSIKKRYSEWYERAIEELFKEIELMNDLVPYEELNEQKLRLEKLGGTFVRNKEELNEFVSAIERKDIETFEELELGKVRGIEEIQFIPTPRIPTPRSHKPKNFSVVLDAITIAKEIEDIEKKIEKISRFMRNVITLAKRIR